MGHMERINEPLQAAKESTEWSSLGEYLQATFSHDINAKDCIYRPLGCKMELLSINEYDVTIRFEVMPKESLI